MKKKENKVYKNGWENYRNAVIENKNKSQDDFEKYINLLATGGIVLSLTFLEKFVSVTLISFLWTYIFGLVLLVFTLLSNLYSHYKSINDSDMIIKEIDEKKYDEIFQNIEKRNKPINQLNKASIWCLITGSALILFFITINLNSMNETQIPKPCDAPNINPKPDTGRPNPAPSPIIKPKK